MSPTLFAATPAMATDKGISLPSITQPKQKQEKAILRTRPSSGNPFPRVRRLSYEDGNHLKQLEVGFILDGVPLSRVTNEETGRTNPSINIGIPQYNALTDKHCKSYFKTKSLPQAIAKPSDKSSMAGGVLDEFTKTTEAWIYMKERETLGAHYTRRIYGGHITVPTEPPKTGYHGEEGYRKNTPDLRRRPSVFDYEDPFENPKPLFRHSRTLSAPATIKLMRQKSATAYQSNPGGRGYHPTRIPGRQIYSAMPRTTNTVIESGRELATGPMC